MIWSSINFGLLLFFCLALSNFEDWTLCDLNKNTNHVSLWKSKKNHCSALGERIVLDLIEKR